MVPIAAQPQGHGDCLPLVPPTGRGGGLRGAVGLIETAQEVETIVCHRGRVEKAG